jgi:hypothetical protein
MWCMCMLDPGMHCLGMRGHREAHQNREPIVSYGKNLILVDVLAKDIRAQYFLKAILLISTLNSCLIFVRSLILNSVTMGNKPTTWSLY